MNNKNILINAGIFLAIILVAWLLVWGKISQLRSIQAQITARLGTITLEKQVIQKLNSISQVLDTQKSNVERLNQAIPTEDQQPEILSMIENISSQNGLNLISLDITTPEEAPLPSGVKARNLPIKKQLLKQLQVTTNLEGNYASLKNWLTAMEKNLRIMDVNKITFKIKESLTTTNVTGPTIDPTFDFAIDTTTYVLKKQ